MIDSSEIVLIVPIDVLYIKRETFREKINSMYKISPEIHFESLSDTFSDQILDWIQTDINDGRIPDVVYKHFCKQNGLCTIFNKSNN